MNYTRTDKPGTGTSYRQATGKMPYSLTNDYLFRALLQRNNRVLKHLICDLLHLQPETVRTVTIENPIVLGEALDNKTFILDIRVALDNFALIDLEMQIVNYQNWPERSLSYLCRNFDQLHRGGEYREIRPAIQISFLDFTLFPGHAEFYATYKMMNVKDHHVLTDKFVLSVLNLKQIERATEEDRQWNIHHWAALFKATTWEEAKMLAEKDPIMEDAVVTMYEMTAEDAIREQCRAREEYYRTIHTYEAEIQAKERQLDEQTCQLDEQARQLDEQTRQLDKQTRQLDERTRQLDEQTRQLDEQSRQLDEQSRQLDEQTHQIDELHQMIESLKRQLAVNTEGSSLS